MQPNRLRRGLASDLIKGSIPAFARKERINTAKHARGAVRAITLNCNLLQSLRLSARRTSALWAGSIETRGLLLRSRRRRREFREECLRNTWKMLVGTPIDPLRLSRAT